MFSRQTLGRFVSKSIPFDQDRDIPSLDGKVILVTGGNSGLGKQAVLDFARHGPKHIWLAARSLNKANAAADEIRSEVPGAPIQALELDLASFDSVKAAAKTVLAASDRLDILMLNAGIFLAPPGQTKDGYELQFGTNYMGHALFARLLLPLLDAAAKGDGADVRVVSVTSHGQAWAPPAGIAFASLKTDGAALGASTCYGQSKLANTLFARELARRRPRITASAVHPGVVNTNLAAGATGGPWGLHTFLNFGMRFMTGVSTGVKNQLWASVSPDVVSGEYYEDVGRGGLAPPLAVDDELAKKLWEWTDKELESQVV